MCMREIYLAHPALIANKSTAVSKTAFHPTYTIDLGRSKFFHFRVHGTGIERLDWGIGKVQPINRFRMLKYPWIFKQSKSKSHCKWQVWKVDVRFITRHTIFKKCIKSKLLLIHILFNYLLVVGTKPIPRTRIKFR